MIGIRSTFTTSDRRSSSSEEVGQLVDRIANIGYVVAVDIHRGEARDGRTAEQIPQHPNCIADVDGSIAVGISDGEWWKVDGDTTTVWIVTIYEAVPIVIDTVRTIFTPAAIPYIHHCEGWEVCSSQDKLGGTSRNRRIVMKLDRVS